MKVGKTPYVRFDLNDYSVPHTHVRRTLAVLADEHTRAHPRRRRRAGPPRAQLGPRPADRGSGPRAARWSSTSARRAPTAAATAWRRPRRRPATLLERAAARGDNLGSITAALLRLLERYGARGAAGGHPARRCSAMCRTPTPCAWRWSARARTAASPRRWRWCCPSTWRGATRRCGPTPWVPTTARHDRPTSNR